MCAICNKSKIFNVTESLPGCLQIKTASFQSPFVKEAVKGRKQLNKHHNNPKIFASLVFEENASSLYI